MGAEFPNRNFIYLTSSQAHSSREGPLLKGEERAQGEGECECEGQTSPSQSRASNYGDYLFGMKLVPALLRKDCLFGSLFQGLFRRASKFKGKICVRNLVPLSGEVEQLTVNWSYFGFQGSGWYSQLCRNFPTLPSDSALHLSGVSRRVCQGS